jgi:hypothetical protein
MLMTKGRKPVNKSFFCVEKLIGIIHTYEEEAFFVVNWNVFEEVNRLSVGVLRPTLINQSLDNRYLTLVIMEDDGKVKATLHQAGSLFFNLGFVTVHGLPNTPAAAAAAAPSMNISQGGGG